MPAASSARRSAAYRVSMYCEKRRIRRVRPAATGAAGCGSARGRAGPIERRNHAYEFRFRGDAEAASELLAKLVLRGVRISSFVRRRDNLEELFLKVGSKELS